MGWKVLLRNVFPTHFSPVKICRRESNVAASYRAFADTKMRVRSQVKGAMKAMSHCQKGSTGNARTLYLDALDWPRS